ncbi:hypothetical protein [Hyphococcus luteus]|uniref:Uncharacterized protein n=1 Tax=Hyphococcus luteus TaxID=2058213 RepID=A0A2S7KAX1_9PROT|nr:hypothetical protein [Marinicaulis flavus]PQA89608.1 hypothetical protein CW354_01715 [Marinicaulis flavus]
MALAVAGCGQSGGANDERQSRAGLPAARENSARAGFTPARIDGSIAAIINGEKRDWLVTHATVDGKIKSRSRWNGNVGKAAIVTLFGHLKPTIDRRGEGEILLHFIIPDIDQPYVLASEKIDYFPDGIVNKWSSENGGAVNVTIDKVQREGEDLIVKGAFSGTVAAPEKILAETPDEMKRFEISNGKFETRIIAR